MEIYEQMDEQSQMLNNDTALQGYQNQMKEKIQELQDIVSVQFQEWHEALLR